MKTLYELIAVLSPVLSVFLFSKAFVRSPQIFGVLACLLAIVDGFFFALAIIFCSGNGLSEAFYFWTGFIGSAVIALTAIVDVDKLDSTAESFVYFLGAICFGLVSAFCLIDIASMAVDGIFVGIVMAGIIAYVAFSCYLLMTDQMEQIIGRK